MADMSRARSSIGSWLVLLPAVASACDAPPGESSAGLGGSETSPSMLQDEPIRPRWLLRDKDGALVPAFVEPHCGNFSDCRLPDVGASPQFPCVHVRVFKDRYVGLLYGLADGTLSSCSHDASPLSPISTCSQQPGCAGPFFAFEEDKPLRPHAPRATYLHEGKFLYVSTSKEPVAMSCFYLDPVDGCTESQVVTEGFPLLPVPDEFIDLLADGAPYTFEVAYD